MCRYHSCSSIKEVKIMIVPIRPLKLDLIVIRINAQKAPEIEESSYKDGSAALYITAASVKDAAKILTEYAEKDNNK